MSPFPALPPSPSPPLVIPRAITTSVDSSQIFTEKLENEIRIAKREGSYDLGLLELNSDSGKVTENVAPETLRAADCSGGVEATLRSFEVDRGIVWEAAEKVDPFL
jgi:hypothetical protein